MPATIETLYTDDESRLRVQVAHGVDSTFYQTVRSVRASRNPGPSEFGFDAHSYHYLMTLAEEPIGCVTATCYRDGPVDCQDHYPPLWLFDRYGESLVSICKSNVVGSPVAGLRTFRRLVRSVWADQLRRGTRVDVINVTRDNQRIFHRIGYRVIDGYDFTHPSLGTDSITMCLSADPGHRSFFQDLHQEVSDPLPMTEVLAAVDSSGQRFDGETI